MERERSSIFEINGSNGASFYFSTNSFRNWRLSLEFYRAVSLSARIKKLILTFAYPAIRFRSRKTSSQISSDIKAKLSLDQLPSIGCNDSAMISPTRDKVVIHHHGRSYEKIAVKESFPGVARELEIYKLLNNKHLESFRYSNILSASCGNDEVRFEMSYADGHDSATSPELSQLIQPLVDFFAANGLQERSWQDLWDSLDLDFTVPVERTKGAIKTGLVHRDFKPWNVKSGAKPLFFDFESAAYDGAPLEDLFNYQCDPMLHFSTAEKVAYYLAKDRNLGFLIEKYLNALNIPFEEVSRLRDWYLLERYSFWKKMQPDFAKKYLDVYKLLNQNT